MPHDGDDGELDEVTHGEGVAGTGKGRRLLTQGGRLFVTPPSRRTPEGRGGGPGRKTAGTMDEGSNTKPSPPAAERTMGPMPPDPEVEPKKRDETQGNLQRALEAEMVVFLREQNAQLKEELARLKKGTPDGSSSVPSSWEHVESSGCGKGQPGEDGLDGVRVGGDRLSAGNRLYVEHARGTTFDSKGTQSDIPEGAW